MFQKFLVAKKFMDKGGGEYQVFPSEMFRLAVPKNFVVESFPVEIFSGTEKLWIKGGGREYQDLPSKVFCLKVPKNFVGEPFGVSENIWYRKILCLRGLCQDFPSKTFCLTVSKYFVGESFTVAVTSGTGNVWIRWGGGNQDFPLKFFCLTVPEIFVENPLLLQ